MTVQSILQTCVTQAAQQGPSLMAQWLAVASQSLAVQANPSVADEATPTPANQQASQALRLLQAHAAALCPAYGTALWQQFLAPPATAHAHSTELALVDATEHDAQVELLRAQEYLCHATDGALSELNALVSAAQGLRHVQADTNPLRPANYLHALQQVLAPIAPNPLVLQLWMQHLLPALGPSLLLSYQQAVAYLRQQGVRPANYGLAASHFSPVPPPPTSPSLYAQAAQAEEEALTASILHQLLQSGALPYASAYGSMYGGMVADPAAQAAEVVAQMMDNIAQDTRLLPPIRQALLNMEPAIGQLAIHDAQFFNDPEHPARQLLDDITERGLAFGSEASPGFHVFMHLLDQVVQRLAQQEQPQAASFSQVLQALHKAWQAQAERAKPPATTATTAPPPPGPATMPAARTIDPQQRYQTLCNDIAQTIRRLPDSKQVPAPIMDFATSVWAQVIARVQLEQTANSTDNDPHGYLALVPLLFWSVRPHLPAEERQQIAPEVPKLLQSITRGLQHIAYPTSDIQQLLRLLKSIHQDTLTVQAPPPPPPPPPVAAASGPDIDLNFDQTVDVDIEIEMEPLYASPASPVAATPAPVPASQTAPLADTAAPTSPPTSSTSTSPEIPLGTWVELRRQQQTVRTQLTWANPNGSLFLFTAADGSTQSMTRRVRDRLLATGELRLLR
jgi:hypothetical protein